MKRRAIFYNKLMSAIVRSVFAHNFAYLASTDYNNRSNVILPPSETHVISDRIHVRHIHQKDRKSKNSNDNNRQLGGDDFDGMATSRVNCALAMQRASITMATQTLNLWKHSVPDEALLGLPCCIAYQMIESATGVHAKKASNGDDSLHTIAATVNSAP